ncbi:MAG: ATP-binding protein [Candidatus Latescibacteria bacterium]|nr:ATP-binding protein [Candidatus Latescibacterota bacterium]
MNLEEFQIHNSHLEGAFSDLDPHLRRLRAQPLIYRFPLLDRLPRNQPGIYTVGGGRQIGKTTLLKQWMADLLATGIDPSRLRFFTGELIDDHHALVRLVSSLQREMPTEGRRYILLDEVTYIAGWDKGIKYLADAGLLEGVVLIATGSDMAVIQEARMRFPGRRGKAAEVDFHLHPLSFAAAVGLKRSLSNQELLQLAQPRSPLPAETEQILREEFLAYLVHGGFLTAINDMARHDRILPATFATYSDWIRGDMLKRGKQEHYLGEVLAAIVRCCGTQTTYNALARTLSIDHPATVSDYVALLTSMDVLRVQPALREDKLTGAPKKARKISFCDPFIFHAVQSWLHAAQDPFAAQVRPLLADPERTGPLVEACAVAHYSRRYPTYYIKGEGEVDIAYVKDGRFWPVEIKWTSQLRPKTLKQIGKYANSRILARRSTPESIGDIPVEFLPQALLRLDLEERP